MFAKIAAILIGIIWGFFSAMVVFIGGFGFNAFIIILLFTVFLPGGIAMIEGTIINFLFQSEIGLGLLWPLSMFNAIVLTYILILLLTDAIRKRIVYRR